MVKSVAKTLFKQDNPNRRLPGSFLEGISLQLTGLENGSAIPRISLVVNPAAMMRADNISLSRKYAEKAREEIVQTIYQAGKSSGSSFPTRMTRQQLAMFNRFGSELMEDETIEFPVSGQSANAVFTQNVRKRILKNASLEHYVLPTIIYGLVSELDKFKKTFIVDAVSGQRVQVQQYAEEVEEDVNEAFSKYEQGQKVKITGRGLYSSNSRLEALDELEAISLLDAVDFGYRLAEIAELKDGWFDGKGKAFDRERLSQLEKLYNDYYSLEKSPYLYPMPEGTIQAEWEAGEWIISLEMDLETLMGDFYALNQMRNEEQSHVIDLKRAEQWDMLCKAVSEPQGVLRQNE